MPISKYPLWLAYWVAGLMPLYGELTGTQPIFTRYSLDAIGSNSHFSHAKASRELGFQPRPASPGNYGCRQVVPAGAGSGFANTFNDAQSGDLTAALFSGSIIAPEENLCHP